MPVVHVCAKEEKSLEKKFPFLTFMRHKAKASLFLIIVENARTLLGVYDEGD